MRLRRSARRTTRGSLLRDEKSVAPKRHRDRERERWRGKHPRSTTPSLQPATEAGLRILRGGPNATRIVRAKRRKLRSRVSCRCDLPSRCPKSTSCHPISPLRPEWRASRLWGQPGPSSGSRSGTREDERRADGRLSFWFAFTGPAAHLERPHWIEWRCNKILRWLVSSENPQGKTVPAGAKPY